MFVNGVNARCKITRRWSGRSIFSNTELIRCWIMGEIGKSMKRTFALILAALAAATLVGVVIGGLALRRSAGRIGTGNGRMRAIVALVTGLIAVVNGGLNLAIAKG